MSLADSDPFVAMSMLAGSGAGLAGAFDRFIEVARKDWPDIVEVEREGLFGRGHARKVVIRLPGRAYVARREGPSLVFEIGTLIRGAIVRTDPVGLVAWRDALQAEVNRVVNESLDAQRFLETGDAPPSLSSENEGTPG